MADSSNFTTPDAGGSTWDPVAQRWVPSDGSLDSNANANPNGSDPRVMGGGAPTAGRVAASSADRGSNTGSAWGGYTGTMVRGPDGNVYYDQGQSGRQADVDRLRGLGETAANRQAYQNDYGQANSDAAMGAQSRGNQDYGAALARESALGINSQSQQLGQRMLAQGAQTQQAAAMSARGGSLAQMAASRQQQAGQGSYLQQGNTALRANLADEMAAGRSQYQQATTQMRQQDAQAQSLNQQQAISQMNNEVGQRELNQQGQMGYEGMAQNVNKAAQNAALQSQELQVGIDAAASARAQRQADRDLATAGAVAGTAGALVGGLSRMGEGGGEEKKSGDLDPYSRAISNSDYRSKRGVTSLAAAAAARGRR